MRPWCPTHELAQSSRRTSVIDLRLLFLRAMSIRLQAGPCKISRSLLENVRSVNLNLIPLATQEYVYGYATIAFPPPSVGNSKNSSLSCCVSTAPKS
jgi:hypothetical protein